MPKGKWGRYQEEMDVEGATTVSTVAPFESPQIPPSYVLLPNMSCSPMSINLSAHAVPSTQDAFSFLLLSEHLLVF